MKDRKKWAVLGIVAAVAAGLLAGVVMFAQGSDEETAGSLWADTFLGRVAANLGVSVEELLSAITQAQLAEIDEALADGRITEEQADWMRERIEVFQSEIQLIEDALAEGKITPAQAELMLGGRGLFGLGRMGMPGRGFLPRGRMGYGPWGCKN